jgi:parallel beta-helix repeat protein
MKRGAEIVAQSWGCFLLILLLAACPGAHAQTTIHVPADQPTIQAGIDAAGNGDTVLVAPGTYAESLDFKGKNITVTTGAKTYADAGAVVLQQVGTQAVAIFRSGESQAAVLNGFLIQNGQNTMIAVTSSSPTISNNVLSNITGCGIVITGAGGSPVVRGNHISGMKLQQLIQCSGGLGSAIVASQAGDVSIIDNTFDQADETNPGPGSVTNLITMYFCSSVLLQNNIIRDNTTADALIRGGNIGRLSMIQNAIYNNVQKSTQSSNYPVPGILIDIEDNQLPPSYQAANNGLFLNNTIANNNIAASPVYPSHSLQQLFYSAFYVGALPPAEFFENNLLIGTMDGPTALCQFSPGQSTTFSYSDAFNTGVLVPPASCTSTGTAAANIGQDPQFLNLTGGDVRIAHTSPAVYTGDINAPSLPAADLAGKNRTVCGKIDMGAYQTHPHPPITLSANPNPVAGGSVVTFTAQVTGNCNVPTGDVTFLDNGTPLGTGTLNGSAVATLSTSFLTVGTHHLTATYPGDFNFEDGTSNGVDLTVTGLPTTTTLNVAPNPAKAFQPITFTANVTDPFVPVTGTVTFTAGTTTLGTASLVNGIAAITSSQLGAGTYTVTATFNATTQFASSSAFVQLQVDGAATTTTLRSSLNPSLFGQSVTFGATVVFPGSTAVPQGTVTFRDGATTLGTGSLDGTGAASFATTQLTVGSHSITAAYGGSTNANASTSPILIQIVNPVPTTVTLTGTPNPASVGQQVTFTAVISGTLGGAPSSGTVNFADQNGTIGTAAVNAGSAVLSTSTLAAGTHILTATFLANGVFAGGTSQPYTEVIQSFDFTITLSSPTLSVASGASSTLTAQIQGVGNVAGNVTLTAANVPQNATLTFNPTSISFAAGGSGSSVITLTTALQPHASLSSKPGVIVGSTARILAAFALVPVFFVRRRKIRTICLMLTGLISLASFSGCTNIYFPVSRLAPGTYVIPITGVDQISKISHTVNLTLNVTQ